MEELEQKLQEVLSDPEQMQKIMALAGSLGQLAPPPPSADAALSVPPVAGDRPAASAEKNREALLAALRPFLRPERQKKLEQAMQLARLSALAELALQRRAERGGKE